MELGVHIQGKSVMTGKRRQVRVPYDGALFAEVHQAGAEELESALAAAHQAAAAQRETPIHERAAILRRAAEKLAAEKERFAWAIASEAGKPLRDARVEIERGIQTLLFSAVEALKLGGEFLPLEAAPAGVGHWAITVREPLGVIAAITPFNFPLNLSLHKIAPAIAAGNTIVHKPASATPVSALMLARLLEEVGLREGVLNVVPGAGGVLGKRLVTDERVAMVTFTGSAEVGKEIREWAGLRRVTLELGSNAAVIVERDAALEEAAARCAVGAFALAGQSCISVQRIYAQRRVLERFVELLGDAAQRLRVGHPHKEETEVSSLITEQEARRVEEWVEEAREGGAKVVCGGARQGAVMAPAVLIDVPWQARLHAREVFGPVVLVNAYETLEEAIAMVNASEFGLQAAIYTRDMKAAFQAARQVHAGGFWINEIPTYRVDHMPYGGVKMSGVGREGPRYAIEEMTELKLIGWKL